MISNNSKGSAWRFLRKRASVAITPVSSKAIAIIIKDSTVMVAALENPEIASSGFTSPSTARETMMNKAILSTGNTSNAKRMMVMKREKMDHLNVFQDVRELKLLTLKEILLLFVHGHRGYHILLIGHKNHPHIRSPLFYGSCFNAWYRCFFYS